MNLTIEALEKVMDGAKAAYKEAKEALLDAAGDIDTAITAIREKHEAQTRCAEETAEAPAEETAEAPAEEPEAEAPAEEPEAEAPAEEPEAEAPAEEPAAEAPAEEAAEEPEAEAPEAETISLDTEAEAADEDVKKSATPNIDELIAKMKKLVAEGNVDRIVVKRHDEVILNLPVNVGIIGGLIGFTAAPWAAVAAVAAAYGLSCKFEIVKKDGSTDEVL